jgi:hypothetical protein
MFYILHGSNEPIKENLMDNQFLLDLMHKISLNPNDPIIYDLLISELQRKQLSPKLNEIITESNKLKEREQPLPDFEFIKKFVIESNNILNSLASYSNNSFVLKWIGVTRNSKRWMCDSSAEYILKLDNISYCNYFEKYDLEKCTENIGSIFKYDFIIQDQRISRDSKIPSFSGLNLLFSVCGNIIGSKHNRLIVQVKKFEDDEYLDRGTFTSDQILTGLDPFLRGLISFYLQNNVVPNEIFPEAPPALVYGSDTMNLILSAVLPEE